jgi:hypothetical protein
MYVFKIIIVSFFLLHAAIVADAQSSIDSTHINLPKTDSPAIQPHISEVNGVRIIDSTAAASADTVPKTDTVKVKKHTAVKAVWLSAVCPGLGQAYNKKYWKIPIIWAGFGGLGYALYYTNLNFNIARAAYRIAVRTPYAPGYYNGYPYADVADIKYYRDTYKNYLNISALVTVIWYGLNLIDAAVDGHLYSYNMDNKLSFNFDPSFIMDNPLGMNQTCLGLTFTIKPMAGKRKTALVSF